MRTTRALFIALGGLAGALGGALYGLNEIQLGTTLVKSADPAGVLRDAAIGLAVGVVAAAGVAPFLEPERLEKVARGLVVAIVALAVGVTAALFGG